MSISFFCNGDSTYHYKSEIPKTLQPFWDYMFSSGGIAGKDFISFDTKYKNVIKKLLPEGYTIHKWMRNHYSSSWIIKTPDGRFIYCGYSDVRSWTNEWCTNILIRTMAHEKDWHGGMNQRTCLFTFSEDVKKIYK